MPVLIGVKSGYRDLADDYFSRLAAAGAADFTEFDMKGTVLPDPRAYREDLPALVVHAPHYCSHRTNPVDPLDRDNALRLLEASSRAADVLGSRVIVVHPERRTSPECSAEHLVAVLREHGDPRCAVENMPCPGFFATDPAEIAAVMAEARCGFVLDAAHAACFAFATGLGITAYLRELATLGPVHWHVGDTPLVLGTGSYSNGLPPAAPGPWCEDMHLPLGEGDLDWAAIAALLPAGATVTLETPMRLPSQLEDAARLRSLCP